MFNTELIQLCKGRKIKYKITERPDHIEFARVGFTFLFGKQTRCECFNESGVKYQCEEEIKEMHRTKNLDTKRIVRSILAEPSERDKKKRLPVKKDTTLCVCETLENLTIICDGSPKTLLVEGESQIFKCNNCQCQQKCLMNKEYQIICKEIVCITEDILDINQISREMGDTWI